MRVTDQVLRNIGYAMGPYFSPIVVATGELTPDQMRGAIRQAYRDGAIPSLVGSDRSLQMVNEAYIEGPPIQ